MTLQIEQIPGKGRGIVTTVPFEENDIVGQCPIVVLSEDDTALLLDTVLAKYQFPYWFDDEGEKDEDIHKTAIAMGLPSLLNTSANPNVFWWIDPATLTLYIQANQAIAAGDEITMWYGSISARLAEEGWVE